LHGELLRANYVVPITAQSLALLSRQSTDAARDAPATAATVLLFVPFVRCPVDVVRGGGAVQSRIASGACPAAPRFNPKLPQSLCKDAASRAEHKEATVEPGAAASVVVGLSKLRENAALGEHSSEHLNATDENDVKIRVV
jgi:hypothetical protein